VILFCTFFITACDIKDLRDTKIVQLAKKVRNLTLALNKERALRQSQDNRIAEMTREIDHLNRDLKLVASPAARAAATRDAKNEGSAPQRDVKKDLTVALKQVG
jgi:hypothetical protein